MAAILVVAICALVPVGSVLQPILVLGSGMRCASPRLGLAQSNSMQPGRIYFAFILAFVIGYIINMFAMSSMFLYVSLCLLWFSMFWYVLVCFIMF